MKIPTENSLKALREKLQALSEKKELESLIEVELLEEQYDAIKLYELDELVSNFDKPGYRIVKHRASFQKQRKGASEAYENEVTLQDLKPKDVFLELIANHEYEDETRQEILTAFDEIMEEINQDEKL